MNKTLAALSIVMSACLPLRAADADVLWQIGKADNDTREFALAPGNNGRYEADGLFAIGMSDPARDWPYVHPGPADAWAGSQKHTFSIVFAVKTLPDAADCRLLLDLVDTHGSRPPKLAIRVNGHTFSHQCPEGAGDESVYGDPSKGREHKFAIPITRDVLKAGDNHIAITNLSGSWVLYDAISFEAPKSMKLTEPSSATMLLSVDSPPGLIKEGGALRRQVRVVLQHIGEETAATVSVTGAEPREMKLSTGKHEIAVDVPPMKKQMTVDVKVEVDGETVARREQVLEPARKWVVYLLPHSHVDIGYTQLQTKVERDHWRYFEQAISASKRTADYPPGAQFKWNAEVLWAVDSYLRQAPREKQQAFVDAVKKGWIGLDALYGNELTALCRPEELIRLVDYSQKLAKRCGVEINSAMITDVPGYTWGIVPVLAGSGVEYFSIGPNGGHRIGHTLSAWGDRPFYWESPAGDRKVLCWVAGTGYYRVIGVNDKSGGGLFKYLGGLENSGYPYDIVQMRYSLGDNQGPGLAMSDYVKEWNAKYAYPKLVIATTREMFTEFEHRYGDKLPTFRGDFTPYWEDGAGSSSRETGLNRDAAERLVQAEAIFAMNQPTSYPAERFYDAWRDVILYDEHTWGAYNSISEPDSDFAKGQWKIKQAFALNGDRKSRELLDDALAKRGDTVASAIDVLNTSSWPVTDIVPVPSGLEAPGGVPSQKLSSGETVFVAKDVPPLGSRRYRSGGAKPRSGAAIAEGSRLTNGLITVEVDEKTGAVSRLSAKGIAGNLVDDSENTGLNDFFYVPGRDPKTAERNAPVKISVKERGPLVASLLIECDAPGCNSLSRELRLIDGINRLDIINIVDKKKVRTKESVHFAFPLNVPEGVMRMNTTWAVVRPEADQLVGACKNYYTVQRWIDVSNEDYGVTWATIDAPLVEVGGITVDIPFLKTNKPGQTFYSYVMNNYWETNYKADQQGPTTFRYSIRPHANGYRPSAAERFGTDRSRPLIAVPAAGKEPPPSRLTIQPQGVVVTGLKPVDGGDALLVRLFGASGKQQQAKLNWSKPKPVSVRLCKTLHGEPGRRVDGPVAVPAMGIVTLWAELR